MIGISTYLFDLAGTLAIPKQRIKNNVFYEKSRRASSVKTLDGDSYSMDFGYSVTDEDLVIEFLNLTKDEVAVIDRMIEIHSKIYVCSELGAFLCIFKNLRVFNETSRLTFIIVGTA